MTGPVFLSTGVVLLYVISSSAGTPIWSPFSNLQEVRKGLTNDLAAAKQPVQEALSAIGFGQCENAKKILGVAHSPYDGPNLDLLKLQFRRRNEIYIIKLNEIIEILPYLFNPRDKLVIFLHGFISDPLQSGFEDISQSFLERGGYNILALDASELIKTEYILATTYVRFIGEKLGEVLAAMFEEDLRPGDIHLIAHSLGAHIAGFAGKTFQYHTGVRLGRISGLDPAGPCFNQVDPSMRLESSDAEYVDVVHTNAGVFGIKEPIGHADYYVNGGTRQPGCLLQTCSHSKAWLYYAESVTNETAFPAAKCSMQTREESCDYSDISYMGFASSGHGIFFLTTSDEAPYGLWQNGLQNRSEGGVLRNVVQAGHDTLAGILGYAAGLVG